MSQLPFEIIEVDDIYTHANEIVKKNYPDTNYNFPKLYTDKYDLESEGYKYFDSFINNRVAPAGSTVKIFPKNEIQENSTGWDVINRNIIHPMPYWLYVLKVGFQDAGFELTGDILTDTYLKQRCIFGNQEYHTTVDQKYQKTYVFDEEFIDNKVVNGEIFGSWKKTFTISAPGKYRFIGSCFTNFSGSSTLTIKKNGSVLQVFNSQSNAQLLSFDKEITIDIAESESNPVYSFEFFGKTQEDRSNSEDVNIGVAEININPMRQNTVAGDPIPFIFNFNRVDIAKAVPDWGFGELVNLVKNWRNYDLTFESGKAIMNRIVVDKKAEPEDFTQYEIDDPIRSKNDKRYFYIKFPDSENTTSENVLFSNGTYQLNPGSVPSDATTIDINGLCLPLTTFRANTTAKALDESALMLVYYDGLDMNGNNHAKNPAGLNGAHFAEDNKDWYLNRLTNFTFKWTFTINKNKMRRFNIRSEIYAFQKKHWIKSWVVNSISDLNYSVEIETETF